MTDPILGFGTQLAVDRGGGYLTFARMVEIGEFGGDGDDVDVTTHASTSGFREFIRGLVDGGELPFTGIWLADTTPLDLMTDLLGGTGQPTLYPYKITLPGGYGTYIANGYVKGFKINPQMDGRLECSGSLKVSGVPAFTTTQSAGLTTPFFSMTGSAVITPAPAQNTLTYVATVLTGVASLTITPTAAAGVITVNGTVVASGVASGTITLGAAGSLTNIIVRVKETGKSEKVYTITVDRP